MGGICAKCSSVEKGQEAASVPGPPQEDLPDSEAEGDEGSEVVASSDEDDPNAYKKEVADTLRTTGDNLKRGKTMAMKEVISTAKKLGLDGGAIANAEKQLDEHKKKQKREATEEAVQQFFESKVANEIPQAEKMLQKAKEAECGPEVIEKIDKHLGYLIATRPLETGEAEDAREYMKFSCTDFVMSALRNGGRPVVFLNLESGKKSDALLSVDPPLQNIIITMTDVAGDPLQAAITGLSACSALNDSTCRNAKGFNKLEKEDIQCALAVKHEMSIKGAWCLVEPTPIRKDRLVEALVILAEACKGEFMASVSNFVNRSSPRASVKVVG